MTDASDLINRTSTPQVGAAQRDYVLLDASGSMSTRWWESLEAIDKYVAGLHASNIATRVTMATFTTSHDFVYDVCRDATPDAWPSLVSQSPDMYAGSTPLNDAINRIVRQMRDDNPQRAHLLIVTDGDENASKTTTIQAKALLDWCRAKGWQITFLGCDFENSSQAKALGVSEANAVGTSARRLKDATQELSKKRAHFAHFGTPMSWSEDERSRFGGYLNAPGK